MNDGIITVSLGDRSYDIFFGMGVYPQFQEWVARFFQGDPAFVVTDTTVASIYGDDIRKWLSGIPHEVLSLSPGEEGKNWDTAREIYSFLARQGAGRDSLIVAFGGGVVGDLAGFAAATFLRGMPSPPTGVTSWRRASIPAAGSRDGHATGCATGNPATGTWAPGIRWGARTDAARRCSRGCRTPRAARARGPRWCRAAGRWERFS